MADKPSRPEKTLMLRDNVPDGCAVSLAGIDPLVSFASIFREELQARGLGLLPRESGRGRKKLD